VGIAGAWAVVAFGATSAVATTGPSGPTAPTLSIAVSSPAFSPNGDGRFEAVTASVTVGEPGTLTLEVLDATGGVVRTIALDEPITAGETETAWRGLDDARTVVPDGTYTLRASVVDALGDTATAETSVTVDTTPPRLRWRSIAPDPVRTSNGEVTFSLSMGAGAARHVERRSPRASGRVDGLRWARAADVEPP
jgi:hypothetical protein